MSRSTASTGSGRSFRRASATRRMNHASCDGVAPSVSGTSCDGSASGASPQVALDEVGQRLVREARTQQPAGEARVVGEPAQTDALTEQRLHLRLGVVQHLRRVGLQPRAQRRGRLLRPVELAQLAPGGDADAHGCAGLHHDPESDISALSRGPGGQIGGGHLCRRRHLDDGGRVVGHLARTDGLEDPRQQRAELESGEDVADGLGIDRGDREIGRCHRQLHVGEQAVELAVAADVFDVIAEVAADHALDLAGTLEQLVEGAELREPLDGRLLPHLRHTGEVVAGLTDEGGDVGVLLGTDAVALLHRRRVVALELRDTLHGRIQQRDVVGDELDGVAVSGDHEHVVALGRP